MGTRHDSTVWDESRLTDPHGQPDKAARVRAMFDEIAPTYSRVNTVLSLGRDAYWRRRAVALAETAATDRVLDVACGTGDFATTFAAASPTVIVGCDFSPRMLRLAALRNRRPIRWCQADAQALPFPDESFSLVSCAFGVRNFQDLDRGLAEMHRVLTPDGRAVILEFSVPRMPLWPSLYLFYFHRVLPRLAALISRDRFGAYRYLPQSVASFVDEADMIARLCRPGFGLVESHRLTIGIVTVFIAWKDR